MHEHVARLKASDNRMLYLWFGPWAAGLAFPAGTVVELRGNSAVKGELEFEGSEERTAVYGWAGSRLQVVHEGPGLSTASGLLDEEVNAFERQVVRPTPRNEREAVLGRAILRHEARRLRGMATRGRPQSAFETRERRSTPRTGRDACVYLDSGGEGRRHSSSRAVARKDVERDLRTAADEGAEPRGPRTAMARGVHRNDGSWFCLVAERPDGELVGFAKGNKSDHPEFAGELNKIYLLREYQRVGLGRRLLGHVVRRFLSQGINSMWLFGDARNPSSGVWTALGAEKTDDDPGNGNYGWRDLRKLAAICKPDRDSSNH